MLEQTKTGAIIVNPNMLAIKAFSDVVNKYKDNHLQIMSYIYFIADFKSPYRKSFADSEVIDRVKSDLNITVSLDNAIVRTAVEKYKELQQVKSLKIFDAADSAIDQIITYFTDFKLSTLNEEKKDDIINKVMKNIAGINSLVTELESARRKVEQDITAKNAVGNQTIRRRELPKHQR